MLAYTFGIYLDLPNVIIHECGHALTARLLGGSIQSIKFNVLPSIVKSGGILGLAEIGNRSGLGMFFSLLGGYMSQALFFIVMSYLYLQGLLLHHAAFLGHLFANEFVGSGKEFLAEPDYPDCDWQFDSGLPE